MQVHFEGSVSINASRQTVYGMLTDPGFIAKNLPDAEEAHVVDDSHLEAKMKVRVAIVSSTLRVKLAIVDKEPTTKATLKAEGTGSGSNVKITSAFTLSGDASTTITWTADAEVTGVIAGLGMTILKGYSAKKVSEVFGGITKSIEEQTRSGSGGGGGEGTTLDKATRVLKTNSTEHGLRTSISYYNQVWARDAFISFIGGNLLADEGLLACAKATIDTFAKTRTSLGQIANFYDLGSGKPDFGFSGSTDSSCWYIVGLANLYAETEDPYLLKEPLDAAVDAFHWLRHQDANNVWLIDSPQGADWMDAAIQRTGKTLYNNALLVMANHCLSYLCGVAGRGLDPQYKLEQQELLRRFNDVFMPSQASMPRVRSFWPRYAAILDERTSRGLESGYYLHYVSFARIDDHLDSLSNLLCLVSGTSNRDESLSILSAIADRKMAEPYPLRCLDPTYRKDDPGFDHHFNETVPPQHRSGEFGYHNGGTWPFIGGFYVCALKKLGLDNAQSQLDSLARANSELKEGESVGFNEWLHGRTGKAMGAFGQSWSAGMYIAAEKALRGRDPFRFLAAA